MITRVLFVLLCLFLLSSVATQVKAADCWQIAYKYAFCRTLVQYGAGTGSCESLAIPKRCWDEEYNYTKRGYKSGLEDAKKKVMDFQDGIPMR